MSYNFKIDDEIYIALSFNTSFDKKTKELAFFIYDSTEEEQKIFIENKKYCQLKLINVIIDLLIIDLNGKKYAFEFNENKDLIKNLFSKKELKIGFAFQDSHNNLIKELCFTVDY